jgi:transglutaminase-like putative cysteine protease
VTVFDARLGASTPRPARYRVATPALAAIPARLAGFGALGAFAALHWAALVDPYPSGRLLGALGLGALGGLALTAASTLTGARRRLLIGAVLAAMTLAALALSGIPLRYAGWRHWDELGQGISTGLSALPGVTVPYRAADQWPGIMIVAGGTLLVMLAAALTFWPRRDGRLGHSWAALIVLADLYAVPIVERNLSHQYARGAAFAALVLCFLALERVRPQHAPAMVVAAALAALGGLALAPRIDGGRSWLDYESIAESLAKSDTVVFDWNHSYGPLDWPRDGTVMLRVKAPRPSYWKAENLDIFDGLRWIGDRASLGPDPRFELPLEAFKRPEWQQKIQVTVRSLRSQLVVGAGTTLAVDKLGRRAAVPGSSAGTFVVRRPLGRGDSYEATVYTPRPTAAELRGAGTGYPGFAQRYTKMILPASPRSAIGAQQVSFGAFASGATAVEFTNFATSGFEAASYMRSSAYSRMWSISQRLAATAPTPYDFARSVEAFLQKGFSYSETPRRTAVPLEAFVARTHTGYCQQFSGAMALMLRMGGVPARVASGFTTGARNKTGGDYVVRDVDAHSWVEVYFPTIGWVPFDPTPAASPARGGSASGSNGGPIPGGRAGLGEDATRPGAGAAGAGASRHGTPAVTIALAAAAGLLVLGLAGLVLLRRRRRVPAADPWLAELERALRRSGRPLAPATTLAELEARLGPGARGYVAKVRARRYGAAGEPPSRGERAELRRELVRGLGAGARLRGWWALPPMR